MKKTRILYEAIEIVFRDLQRPLLPGEILANLEARGLYQFLTEDRLGVVRRELKRHCLNLEYGESRMPKRYTLVDDERFYLIDC